MLSHLRIFENPDAYELTHLQFITNTLQASKLLNTDMYTHKVVKNAKLI